MYFFKKSVITRDDTGPYLTRWTLFGCRFFSIKVHKIMLSDEDCLHDHPWTFLSVILKGGYWEHSPKYSSLFGTRVGAVLDAVKGGVYANAVDKKWYRPLSILYRPALYKHRLELPKDKIAWTLVFTGKPIREWGFWTKKGWIEWFKYDPTKQNC